MLSLVVKLLLFCVYSSLCLWCNEATINVPKNGSLPAVIAFGDSLLDSRNNNFRKTIVKADFPPYGKDFMGGKPTGRFNNRKNLADYTAAKLGVKEYLPAYLDPSLENKDIVTGVTFASGGSGLDPLTSKLVNVFSLTDQVEMFKEYIVKLRGIVGEDEANNIIGTSVYLVSTSSNDWIISYNAIPIRRSQYDKDAYAILLVQKATEFIQEMYNLGARKMVFFNTPYLGCFPLARTAGGGVIRKCDDELNEEAQTFNENLNRQIEFLVSSLPQLRLIIVDQFKIVKYIIDHSLDYGLDVVDRGCCGTGTVEFGVLCNKLSPICSDDSKYLFWDGLHPTDKGFDIVAEYALQDVMNILL